MAEPMERETPLGSNIVYYRGQLGLSGVKFAKSMSWSSKQLLLLEKASLFKRKDCSGVSVYRVEKISAALGVTIDDLLNIESRKKYEVDSIAMKMKKKE